MGNIGIDLKGSLLYRTFLNLIQFDYTLWVSVHIWNLVFYGIFNLLSGLVTFGFFIN